MANVPAGSYGPLGPTPPVFPFYGVSAAPPVIPKLYWDAYSDEQRIKALWQCLDLMASRVNQLGYYYIPNFSGTWSATVEYAPLSVVLAPEGIEGVQEGDSYTALDYVPAGTPLTDGKYWALTGNYNAQVQGFDTRITDAESTAESASQKADAANEAVEGVRSDVGELRSDLTGVQSTVGTLNGEVTTLKGSVSTAQSDISSLETEVDGLSAKIDGAGELTDFVAIGDSYLEGYASSGNNDGWGVTIQNKTGKTCYPYYQGGIGWDNNAVTQITNAMTEHPTVKTGIVVLGINNRDTEYSSIKTGVTNVLNVMKKYPKTNFWIFPCVAAGPTVGTKLLNVEKAVMEAYGEFDNPGNVRVQTQCWTWLIDTDFYDKSDNLHPTQAGQDVIASSIIDCIQGGDPTVLCAPVDVELPGGGNVYATRTGNLVSISFLNCAATDGQAFATITNPCLKGAQVYGSYLTGTDGSVKSFNCVDGLNLKAAYGNMVQGYGNATLIIEAY